MRNIKIAALQFSCCSQVQENIDKAETLVREAASNGANLILLPELFERPYFCQEKRYDYYDYAMPLTENPAIRRFQAVAGELGVVIPVSFYERDVQRLFNSIAMIDADGSILGVYRKTHIPDDHFYQEKFYFTPGDTGFKVFETRFGAVGVGICWDQWFPETARCMAVQGANRIGTETVTPCEENGGQSSSLTFYGSSFIADATGELVASAGRDTEEILYASFDLDSLREERFSWGLFRDRRPETYRIMTKQ